MTARVWARAQRNLRAAQLEPGGEARHSLPCPRWEANAWSGIFVPFTILDQLFGDCTAIFILMQFSTNAFRNRLGGDASDNALIVSGKNMPILPARLHFLVNAQVADIFKRILEAWNSTAVSIPECNKRA